MFPQSDDSPALLIIAGPNGSGKSTAYKDTDIEAGGRSLWIVNPDLLTERIRRAEALSLEESNREAVIRIEAWLEASIDVHKSVGVETVLSTPKYRRLVEHARARGFVIWLIYVLLDSPERNVERVRLRVRKGGHAVDEDKIRARYLRSLEQFPWFLERADRAWIYDNSGAEIRKIGEKENGVVSLDETALPAVFDAARQIRTE